MLFMRSWRSGLLTHVITLVQQLAQHANRAARRHARMTGNAEPTSEELQGQLHRRSGVAKRFQRPDLLTSAEVNARTWHTMNNRPAPRSFANEEQRRHVEGLGKAAFQPSQGHEFFDDHAPKGLKGGKGKALGKGAVAGGGVAGGAVSGSAIAAAAAAAGARVQADDTTEGFSADAVAQQVAGGVTESDDPTTKNAVAFDIEANDVGYLATVQIGTPPKDFRLLMDSGSSDTWVGSAETCKNTDTGSDCGKHTFLGTSTSSSFKASTDAFAVSYGTGAVKGVKVTDDLSFAGLNLKAHSFGVANEESDEFANDKTTFDGIMGLAQSVLAKQKVLTPPEALADTGLVTDAIVSYKMPRFQDKKLDGQITFGAVDPATIDASTSVTLDNISKTGFWEATIDSISVEGTDTGVTGRTAILDTGTTLIVAPLADVESVLALIDGSQTDGQGNFLIPCTTSKPLALTFGGQQFSIDPRDLIFAPVDPNNLTGDCLPGISAGNFGGPTQWLVGDVFLKNVIFTTDVTKNNQQLAKPAA
jgi:hypothetical protein